MNHYFRITAYHPKHNVCAVFDSNGKFEKLWQFSSFLVFKGFNIVEVGADFQEGDLPKVPARPSSPSRNTHAPIPFRRSKRS